MNWTQYLLTLFASILIIVATAYLGIKAGMRKHRDQKSFDLRQQWYEEIIGDLHDAAACYETVALLSNPEQVEDYLGKCRSCENKLFKTSRKRDIYATQGGFQILERLSARFRFYEIIKNVETIEKELSTRHKAVAIIKAELCWHVANFLSAELREELGWDSGIRMRLGIFADQHIPDPLLLEIIGPRQMADGRIVRLVETESGIMYVQLYHDSEGWKRINTVNIEEVGNSKPVPVDKLKTLKITRDLPNYEEIIKSQNTDTGKIGLKIK